MVTSSTQQQNRSFPAVKRTKTSAKCLKMKIAAAKCAKLLFFIVKYKNCEVLVADLVAVA